VSNAGGYYKYVESSVHNKYLSKSMGLYQFFWVIGDMIAASLAVALSSKNVIFYDLDGFQFLKEQPLESGIEYKNGINMLINGKGIACIRKF